MPRVKLTRICRGWYKTANTDPVASIKRHYDMRGVWQIAYGDCIENLSSRRDCLALIESAANDPDTIDPIKVS